jgi:hypothetical protein
VRVQFSTGHGIVPSLLDFAEFSHVRSTDPRSVAEGKYFPKNSKMFCTPGVLAALGCAAATTGLLTTWHVLRELTEEEKSLFKSVVIGLPCSLVAGAIAGVAFPFTWLLWYFRGLSSRK